MPNQSPSGLLPPNPVPSHADRYDGGCSSRMRSMNAPQPPSDWRATYTSGMRPAQITKNCITSL